MGHQRPIQLPIERSQAGSRNGSDAPEPDPKFGPTKMLDLANQLGSVGEGVLELGGVLAAIPVPPGPRQ